jgi:hypothetical protein
MGHYAASCLCGAVRLESSSEPLRVGICHCLDCRKHSGAVFGTYAIFAADAVSITGTTSEYRGRHFCSTCGSSMFGRSDDEIDIAVGSFDAPNQVTPTYELWVRRREHWLPPFPGARLYDGNRTGTDPTEP